ncbi:MAG: hypothetical protein COB08_010975 [Rhodobacteraceae bacterium]|nr:hypothetical protein [Paracoccaceae bacterium]
MVDTLRKDFEIFRDHCVFLRGTHNTFYSLYGKGETQKILVKAAVWFFDDLYRIFADSFFVQVGRICDSPKTYGNANLSLSYIVEELERLGLSTEEIKSLENSILTFNTLTKGARNKAVAHTDVKSVRKGGLLGVHTQEESESFFKDLNEFTDKVAKQLGLDPLDYSVQAGRGDAIDLIRLLRKATEQRNAQ